jgi:flagellar basal-body rod modification protein FlgD
METLVQSTKTSDRFSTLNTIGKEVAYQSDSFNFTGNPVTIGYQIDNNASDVTLSLQLDGTTVATLNGRELNQGNHYLTWNGLTTEGEKAPVGKYTIVISAKAAEGKSVSVLPLVRSTVTGVDLDGTSGSTLITGSGEILYKNILGVYEPERQQPEEEETAANTLDTVADITDNVNDIVN